MWTSWKMLIFYPVVTIIRSDCRFIWWFTSNPSLSAASPNINTPCVTHKCSLYTTLLTHKFRIINTYYIDHTLVLTATHDNENIFGTFGKAQTQDASMNVLSVRPPSWHCDRRLSTSTITSTLMMIRRKYIRNLSCLWWSCPQDSGDKERWLERQNYLLTRVSSLKAVLKMSLLRFPPKQYSSILEEAGSQLTQAPCK